MARKAYYTLDELEDRYIGKVGTPRRDAYEARLKEELQAYHIGVAIKHARREKHLTQAQLGEMMGIKKAQVCKIESGRNVTIDTIGRAFRAMGVAVSLNVGGMQVALW